MSNPQVSASFKRERSTALVLLMLLYAFNFLDRQILVILQEPIKADLGLSDGQLGLLTGLAFALFYVIAGIPIAMWADRGNRRNIICLALSIWSAMTALCGAANNYLQLVLARMGVGIGEAGGSPPAHSIISDYYPPQERGRAFAMYNIGLYIGIFLGFGLGGYLAQNYGWRSAFVIVGMPGLLLALIIRLMMKEPQRGRWDKVNASAPSLGDTMVTLKSNRFFWLVAMGITLANFSAYGIGNFKPSFLSRSHDMELAQIGTYLALVVGLSGVVGTYLSGVLVDRLGLRDQRWYLGVPGLAALAAVPFNVVVFLHDDIRVVFGCMFIAHTFHCMVLSPTLAFVHGTVSPGMRALSSSVLFFLLNLIGLGFGPAFAGFMSDYLSASHGLGTDGLRYALAITSLFGAAGSVLYLVAWLQAGANFRLGKQ